MDQQINTKMRVLKLKPRRFWHIIWLFRLPSMLLVTFDSRFQLSDDNVTMRERIRWWWQLVRFTVVFAIIVMRYETTD